jgi:HSP20 family molecular chaperone IbpA
MTSELETCKQASEDPAENTRPGVTYLPNVDIVEKADELYVLVDMPGAKADQIDVDFENGTLAICGRAEPRQSDDTDYLLEEYGVGDFQRTFKVSEDVDAARISAEYRDGVLQLRLPKAESVKPRKISITAKNGR